MAKKKQAEPELELETAPTESTDTDAESLEVDLKALRVEAITDVVAAVRKDVEQIIEDLFDQTRKNAKAGGEKLVTFANLIQEDLAAQLLVALDDPEKAEATLKHLEGQVKAHLYLTSLTFVIEEQRMIENRLRDIFRVVTSVVLAVVA